ncbi:magnesium transporter [Perilla frutescens var. hirtella]|nr:magnesium transporter [Perilla frutescens var. hirtella]
MFKDNLIGVGLAVGSSAFIGSSFIIKKKGLQRAGALGSRAGSGGHGYLLEPLWWIGMFTMVVGEFANFVAYMYAPAVLVTPLGALSIIVSAVLAHFLLKENLRKLGILGCVLCIVGSTIIVLHAPGEHAISSVEEIWELAVQPAFLLYAASAVAVVLVLVLYCGPRYGQTNIMVYIGVCSVIGSLTVMSVKAIGIAIKLTLEGNSQVAHFKSWVFATVAVTCVITQLNYLNKALDTFNTTVVSPIYYAMFTSLTIVASAIMFKDWSGQSASNIVSVLCGFITVLSGTMVLHNTRDPEKQLTRDYSVLSPQISWVVHSNVILGLFFRLYSAVVAAPRRLRRVLNEQGVGDMYTFSVGNKAVLVVNNYDVLKEVTACISSFTGLDLEPLFGNGIVTSNGKFWAYQRKIIAPELFSDKLKGMTNLIQQSALMLIDSCRGVIDGEAMLKGNNFFQKLTHLQQLTAKKGFSLGIPGMR